MPEHYKNWESLLAWVNDNVKEIVKVLTDNIMSLGNVVSAVHGKYLCFYKGEHRTRSLFAAFILTKSALNVRIRVDPTTFYDPRKLLKEKVYKGWFIKQEGLQEREFKITNLEQIPYAMELIRQSYQIK